MRKRTAVMLSAAALAVAGIVGYLGYTGGRVKYRVNSAQAQELFDKQIEKRKAEGKFTPIDHGKIRFEGDLAHITAHVNAQKLGFSAEADVKATGVPVYKDESFGFDRKGRPADISNFKVTRTKAPEGGAFAETRKKAKEALKKGLEKLDEKMPELGLAEIEETFKREFAVMIDKKAEAALMHVLDGYKFKLGNNPKHVVVKMALEKVEVVGDELEITASVVQFLTSLLIGAVLLVVAALIGFVIIFAMPGLFTAVAIGGIAGLGS